MPVTTDPNDIGTPTDIPPPGAIHLGLSPDGLVDVYCGTLPGDVDATPAAQELLSSAPDTGGLSNADYIYDTVSKLYGGIALPDLSNGGVKSIAFVSGSGQGPYGAFHMGSPPDLDRIVLDSLTASGNYSSGSGLGAAGLTARERRAFVSEHIPGLLGITHVDHPRLKSAEKEHVLRAHVIANQSLRALESALRTRNLSSLPPKAIAAPLPTAKDLADSTKAELAQHLVQANLLTLAHLKGVLAAAVPGRQFLSTALFAAEIIESFEVAAGSANPRQTDGEAVSRVVSFKLAPEIALVPGFNAAVTQQWWHDRHPDWVNDNTQDDQSTDGNAAGVMFLLFLNDYLGVPLDQIIQAMPRQGGAPLGKTYEALLAQTPTLAGGATGKEAFAKMISLLQEIKNPDGTLNLPADGNPFPSMNGSQRGGLFTSAAGASNAFAQDAQSALALEAQLEQQAAALKDTLSQIQSAAPASALARLARSRPARGSAERPAAFSYGPRLPPSVAAGLAQRAAAYRVPQVDQHLQQDIWPHVYNELPGSGTQTYRLQVITGTDQAPQAVQITGTVQSTKFEPDGDLHISFVPDDSNFPTNQSSSEAPLEVEIIYAGPVTQADAKAAKQGYTNPFDTSILSSGVRIRVAGPLIYDRAHGRVDANGNVQYGLEIHPAAALEALGRPATPPAPPPPEPSPAPSPPATPNPLAGTVATALRESVALGQTIASLTALLQKIQGEVPPG
jgi:hypothetical protein